MKYLKRFKLFEMAIIKPLDMAGLIDELIQDRPPSIEQANEISNKYNVDIVTYNQFIESIDMDDEMKAGVPPEHFFMFGSPHTGIHFALMNKHTSKMNLVVKYESFIKFIERIPRTELEKVIKSILKHESIHFQQFGKMGNDPDKYVVDSPITNKKGYFGHHTEVMAHAFSIIDELKNVENRSKEYIMGMIKKGRGHRLLAEYYDTFGSGDKTMKKLNKYLYQYTEELFSED